MRIRLLAVRLRKSPRVHESSFCFIRRLRSMSAHKFLLQLLVSALCCACNTQSFSPNILTRTVILKFSSRNSFIHAYFLDTNARFTVFVLAWQLFCLPLTLHLILNLFDAELLCIHKIWRMQSAVKLRPRQTALCPYNLVPMPMRWFKGKTVLA